METRLPAILSGPFRPTDRSFVCKPILTLLNPDPPSLPPLRWSIESHSRTAKLARRTGLHLFIYGQLINLQGRLLNSSVKGVHGNSPW